ncbi:hypothetical protein [Nakamurella endophytica]|nr:hypothetical protein [Nakamurella endophytica]
MREDVGRNTRYYFNIRTHQVEEEGQSKASELLGPYPDPESAARALESVREREDRKSAEDREWRDGDDG